MNKPRRPTELSRKTLHINDTRIPALERLKLKEKAYRVSDFYLPDGERSASRIMVQEWSDGTKTYSEVSPWLLVDFFSVKG